MNKTPTRTDSGTKLTQPGSSDVRFEIVDWAGNIFGPFGSVEAAAAFARKRWPDQEQDEERTGKGWDIQVVGAE